MTMPGFDLSDLLSTYPILKEVFKRAPKIAKTIEGRLRKGDVSVAMQLEILQAMSTIRKELSGLKDYTPYTAVMTAAMSTPSDQRERIKRELVDSARFAKEMVEAIKDISK